MPLQNRVTPLGEIVAAPWRGKLMGNRGGCLCVGPGRMGERLWASPRWILCELEFRGWRREVMQVGTYTELFFFDEAAGLAAGHRPCAFCRPHAYRRFRTAWLHGNPQFGFDSNVRIEAIDRVLHAERLQGRSQRRFPLGLDEVPHGAMFVAPERPQEPVLRWGEAFGAWSPEGYRPWASCGGETVHVLTPRSTVNALRAGYVPVIGDQGLA